MAKFKDWDLKNLKNKFGGSRVKGIKFLEQCGKGLAIREAACGSRTRSETFWKQASSRSRLETYLAPREFLESAAGGILVCRDPKIRIKPHI